MPKRLKREEELIVQGRMQFSEQVLTELDDEARNQFESQNNLKGEDDSADAGKEPSISPNTKATQISPESAKEFGCVFKEEEEEEAAKMVDQETETDIDMVDMTMMLRYKMRSIYMIKNLETELKTLKSIGKQTPVPKPKSGSIRLSKTRPSTAAVGLNKGNPASHGSSSLTASGFGRILNDFI